MSTNKITSQLTAKIDNYSIFHHLKIFIKVVECHSFSAAAQKLNLTPSSVSRSIAQLEDQLGVVLLKRTTRSLILTEPGQYLLFRAQRLLEELDESLANIARFNHHPQGKLRVTCSIAFGVCHLMKLYSAYRQHYSDVTLSVDLNDQNVNLNEENFDIALRITAHPPTNFALRKICTINCVYCASRQYFEQRGIPQKLEDLEHHDCLINPNVSDNWRYRDHHGNVSALKVNSIIEVNSTLGLLHAALQHQGIVSLPTYMLDDSDLVPVLTDYSVRDNEYSLYALYHPGHYQDPKIRTFIDFLVENIGNTPAWDRGMLTPRTEP